jgi:hypothetical protein
MIVAVAMLTSGTVAAAQQPATVTPRANTEKLMVSFALGGTSISSDDFEDERENGGGFSAQLGWGFTRRFMLLVDASGSVMNSDAEDQFVLLHGDLLGRFHFVSSTRPWVPFIEGGISARVAGQDDAQIVGENGQPQSVDLEISGGGITFGGGLRYHVAPAVALGASLRFTVGEFSTVKFNNVSIDGFELDATSTRLMFGVTWQPMLRKN